MRYCEKYHINFEKELIDKRTKSENMKSISRQDIIKIVSKGWEDASSELIIQSFA